MIRTAHITTFTEETGRLEVAYDALHRLVGSSGAGSGNSYDMAVDYSPSGRIREKLKRSRHAWWLLFFFTCRATIPPQRRLYAAGIQGHENFDFVLQIEK